MKGPHHARLQAALKSAIERGVCTQESLSRAITERDGRKTQTGIGKYLSGKGGALDLDEADIALQHIGSDLSEFLKGTPARELTATERLAHDLAAKPPLRALIEDLRDVPQTQLAAMTELVRTVVLPATAPRGGEKRADRGATVRGARTRSASSKRR